MPSRRHTVAVSAPLRTRMPSAPLPPLVAPFNIIKSCIGCGKIHRANCDSLSGGGARTTRLTENPPQSTSIHRQSTPNPPKNPPPIHLDCIEKSTAEWTCELRVKHGRSRHEVAQRPTAAAMPRIAQKFLPASDRHCPVQSRANCCDDPRLPRAHPRRASGQIKAGFRAGL